MSIPQSHAAVTAEVPLGGDSAQLFAAWRSLAGHHARIADRLISAGENGNPRMTATIHARASLVQALAAVAELYRPTA